MAKTLTEIIEQLKQVDEVVLIEMLRLNATDIVDRFSDLIENDPERYALELEQFFGEDEDDDPSSSL